MKEDDQSLARSADQRDGTPLSESQIPTYRSSESDPNGDESDLFEITIHSLTGTVFQVRVSPWETGDGLKNLLQRSQGIPAIHQHLLHGSKELLYEESLIDQGIVDGASLRLVLSLKGGPINSRRISISDDSMWKEFSDYVDMNKEELYEGSDDDGHVTLLVLQEGEAVNLYRVVENDDGSLSPLNESWKSTSSRPEEPPDEDETYNGENSMLHEKLLDLKVQMEALKISRKERRQQKKPKFKQITPKQKYFSKRQSTQNIPVLSQSDSFKLREDAKPQRRRKSTGGRKPQYVPSFHEDARFKGQVRSSTTRKLATAKPNLSRGKILDELPGQLAPKHVEFSRHPKLESIKASRERTYLGPLKENSMLSPLPYKNRTVEPQSVQVWHGPSYVNDVDSSDGEIVHSSREEVRRSDAPIPFYLNENHTKQNAETDRLTRTQTESSLKTFEDSYDRPKTSPEVLQYRPTSTGTNSSFSENIRLKTTDNRLREIIGILNSSRPSSPITHRSTDSFASQNQNNGQRSFNTPKNSWQSLKGSFSLSITSYQGLQSPRALSTSRTKTNLHLEHRENRSEFAPSKSFHASTSKRSTPDIDIFKRPRSNRSKISTPTRLPPVPKKTKLLRKRCAECSRKLKVSFIFTCRCGLLLCAQHRYAETHDCSFDYKAQGKKFIEMANPLVLPPKLPKI